ncbi:AAA family ATPase [Roseospira visakhapatnamensis]|uniref:Pilus assembly protein CpaE n=1 Tax=Roseospira visakhapatnamensis TaxID=390880 RepID=A0A7W6RGS1_9PROT|nr:AAA family ATPase [Roseospira visakhapatnamensis]MBB4267568.1 pilus assembly protein CpaE [Roseospira visakhapatnamensis]
MRITVDAFVMSEDIRQAVLDVSEDGRLRRSKLRIHDGGLAVAPQVLSQMESPTVLILESDKREQGMLADLEAVADHVAPDTRVLVCGIENNIDLYRRLLGMGVADYLVVPVTAEDLLNTIVRACSDEADSNLAPLISVIGVRGGVGTSALACNLAYKLGHGMDGEVVLLDLDISAGTAAINLNLNPRQSAADVLSQSETLDSLLVERYLQRYDDHLLLLGSKAQLDIAFRPPSEVLEDFLNILRRQYDAVVLDLPRQWSSWVRDTLLDSTAVAVVAYPDLSNLRDTERMMGFLSEKRGMSRPTCLVLNKVGLAPKAELGSKDFEEVMGRAPAASLPFEPTAFGQALNNGEPVIRKGASKAFGKAFARMMEALSLDPLMPSAKARASTKKNVLRALIPAKGR